MNDTKNVCAVVVTYNPENDFYDNVVALSKQVGQVVVVDNNSNNIGQIMDFAKNCSFELIKNQSNLGIATAMNQGAKFALEHGFTYLLTMDDDSFLHEGCVQRLLDVLQNNSENIVSVGTNHESIPIKGEYKICDTLISSGNLTKLSVYNEVGGFNDELFIDCVDFDFSLRIKSLGYNIAMVKDATMSHKLGEIVQIKSIFGKKNRTAHSAFRYYYIYRNGRYIRHTYRMKFMFFCFKLWWRNYKHIIGLILFDEDKLSKLKAIRKGLKDSKKLYHK